MGLLSLALLQVGGSLQYVYFAMGVLIGSAVVPISLAIVWNKTNKVAASLGALGGLTCGMLVWLASSYSLYGDISVSSTGQSLPLLARNVMSLSIGAIVTFFGSTVKPQNFDFKVMRQKIMIVYSRIRKVVERESDD